MDFGKSSENPPRWFLKIIYAQGWCGVKHSHTGAFHPGAIPSVVVKPLWGLLSFVHICVDVNCSSLTSLFSPQIPSPDDSSGVFMPWPAAVAHGAASCACPWALLGCRASPGGWGWMFTKGWVGGPCSPELQTSSCLWGKSSSGGADVAAFWLCSVSFFQADLKGIFWAAITRKGHSLWCVAVVTLPVCSASSGLRNAAPGQFNIHSTLGASCCTHSLVSYWWSRGSTESKWWQPQSDQETIYINKITINIKLPDQNNLWI